MMKNIIVLAVCLTLMALTWAWWQAYRPATALLISTFEECKAAGYPILESYPMQCRTPDGRIFISPQEEYQVVPQ